MWKIVKKFPKYYLKYELFSFLSLTVHSLLMINQGSPKNIAKYKFSWSGLENYLDIYFWKIHCRQVYQMTDSIWPARVPCKMANQTLLRWPIKAKYVNTNVPNLKMLPNLLLNSAPARFAHTGWYTRLLRLLSRFYWMWHGRLFS